MFQFAYIIYINKWFSVDEIRFYLVCSCFIFWVCYVSICLYHTLIKVFQLMKFNFTLFVHVSICLYHTSIEVSFCLYKGFQLMQSLNTFSLHLVRSCYILLISYTDKGFQFLKHNFNLFVHV
jgi:hypothetical protein